jgi:hypothetical protein
VRVVLGDGLRDFPSHDNGVAHTAKRAARSPEDISAVTASRARAKK